MPAKVSEKIRPKVTAGLANEVELVNQYAAPMYAPTAAPMTPAGQSTSIRGADGLLAVSVPEDAKIFVNGNATTSTGADRSYVSRNLQNGMNYSYEVRAEVIRDGKTVEQVKTVNVRAGETARLAFDFSAAAATETALTLHVPADAKVYSGHDYVLSNGKFALAVEPENEDLKRRMARAEQAKKDGTFLIPSTIEAERATNPFLRAGEPAVQRSVDMPGGDPGAVFQALREWKNRF